MSKARVLLGVTGGIAAYKACDLVRLLQRAGYEVRVCLTKHACEFVSCESLRALTHAPVIVEQFGEPQQLAGDIVHISLAQECDYLLIAPASANCLAKLAAGIADDFLTTIALVFGPRRTLVAPAMNVHMFDNPAIQDACALLEKRGMQMIGPAYGMLACGYEGQGKLVALEDIVATLDERFASGEMCADAVCGCGCTGEPSSGMHAGLLQGKRLLITAGPTHEPIDRVRYIANRSSGKMGLALAQVALVQGATLSLVCGPIEQAVFEPFMSWLAQAGLEERLSLHRVQTACEMKAAVDRLVLAQPDLIICAAAVADYRVAFACEGKLKKDDGGLSALEFIENPDILAGLVEQRNSGVLKPEVLIVGFAAETDKHDEHARRKLLKKGCDMLVLNDVSRADRGFSSDKNAATVYLRERGAVEGIPQVSVHKGPSFELMSKGELAQSLVRFFAERM